MINSLIGGGQIYTHSIKMFFQVIGRSFKITLLLTSAILAILGWLYFPKIKSETKHLDNAACVTYLKAVSLNCCKDMYVELIQTLNPKKNKK